MKQLGFFIFFSIVFHFLLSTSALYFAEKFKVNSKLNNVTQIEIIDQNEDPLQQKISKAKQLIKQLKTSVEELKDSSKIARFESEKTQRVKNETKSTKLGPTENSIPQSKLQVSKQIKDQENKDHQNKDKKIETTNGDELPEFARSKQNKAQVVSAQNSAISSILPNDIDESNATNLNTDANTYYSFYSRVEELFYVRWVERVRYYWDHISFEYKKNVLSGKVWPTTLEVWLTSTGEFHSAYIKQGSGYKPFDEAAVFAFKDARFFPNPPRAKIEPDGFVRLRYRFNVLVGAY